jgi:superfamily II DNA or RNA helicase
MDNYTQFLASKRIRATAKGISTHRPLHESLFPFQAKITDWAIRKGCAAIFADCGLGKTRQQLEWADIIAQHTQKSVIILAPLAVGSQTVKEAKAIGVKAIVVSDQSEVVQGVNVTNYGKLHKFDPSVFGGVVLDESGILKSFSGATRHALTDAFRNTPYRLCCTATPAPNDHIELCNHAEFLGIMRGPEVLATFFKHTTESEGPVSKYRLKGHAQSDFWRWMCSWSVMIRHPSDLGFSDDGFILPPLVIKNHVVETSMKAIDTLFPMPANSLSERRAARSGSLTERVRLAADLVNQSSEQFVVWCNLNKESQQLAKVIDGAVEVTGSNSDEYKAEHIVGFAEGRCRVLVSKSMIAGYGVNWQNCHNIVFVGLNDSFEQFYQAIRRCWRFGQKEPVTVHVITSNLENAVLENIRRKETDHEAMAAAMIEHMRTETINSLDMDPNLTDLRRRAKAVDGGDSWEMIHGDVVEAVKTIPDDSIHYSIFSPPFASLFTYSASERDMGNCQDANEFYQHFQFITRDLLRVMMPGRLLSFHCANIPTSLHQNGQIGLVDFRGELIRMFVEAGFIYHSEVLIWKDPVTQMQRTKALGLLHKQVKKDSCMSRQGLPDYLVTMRKPGKNPEPVAGRFEEYFGENAPALSTDEFITRRGSGNRQYEDPKERFSIDVWQRYADPVWSDIKIGDTLQRESAREEKDERHICPLQLTVIRRALELWTNPGDLVLSPFAGIGSEGYESIKAGRRFFGIELKESYFKQCVANLDSALAETQTLFNTHFREADIAAADEFVKEEDNS